MLRLGVVDFDSSHSVEFAKRLNHRLIEDEQWVDGAEVVAGCALPSAITEPAKVREYVRVFTEDLGLPLVPQPEDLFDMVDAVLIESVDGSVHLERARPFLQAGIPTYVDKPFACSLADAKEMCRIADANGAPLFSASSLRYCPEVVQVENDRETFGAVLGCDAFSPASLHPRNPGLFHYGIHGVETLFALMGSGCETVQCVSQNGVDVAVGRWANGRIGTIRGVRAGATGYGFTAYCEKRVVQSAAPTRFIYRELLRRIVQMCRTRVAPVDRREMLEIVAFIEAAIHSAREEGAPKPLGV